MNDKIVKKLWDYFIPALETGAPVYFTFSKNLIEDLLISEFPDKTRSEVYLEYLKIVRELIIVSKNKVKILDQTFQAHLNGFSNVILLISIQVLAVEETVKKDNEFTDAAYFPRLRNLLSDDLTLESSLPFSSLEFERLWETFKIEVLKSSGNVKFLTFDIERNGAFKNKSKPLSQALLSYYDLLRLSSEFYLENSKPTDSLSILNSYISRTTAKLSSRGRICCRDKILRPHIIVQFEYFLSHVNKDLVKNLSKDIVPKNELLIFNINEEQDVFTDEILREILFEDENGDVVVDDGIRRLNFYIKEFGFALARPYFMTMRGSVNGNEEFVNVNECYFVSTSKDFLKVFEESIGIKSIQMEELAIIPLTPFLLYRITDERLFKMQISSNKGTIKKSVSGKEIEFTGGILLDKRKNSFLEGFIFTDILLNNQPIDPNYVLEVNQLKMKFSELFNYLSKNYSQSYRLIINSKTYNFEIVSFKNAELDLIGYLIEKNTIKLKKKKLAADVPALVGLRFINEIPLVDITDRDLINQFLPNLICLNEEKEEILEESIKSSKKISLEQKLFFLRFIKINKKISIELCNKLSA